MDLLFIIRIHIDVSLAIFALATIRITTRKNHSNESGGTICLAIAVATILILVQNIYGVGFCTDIATALINF
jgi:energy-converting hydrogenase B subunit B